MQVKENIKESDRCNCGRSPTGECIGCYFLTGAEFETRLADYLAEQQDCPTSACVRQIGVLD